VKIYLSLSKDIPRCSPPPFSLPSLLSLRHISISHTHTGEATRSLLVLHSGCILVSPQSSSLPFVLLTTPPTGANVSQDTSANNRTAWPLEGGSLTFAGSHPWAYTYVNLGIGNVVTGFNVTVVEGFNQTGNGTFCFPKLSGDAITGLNIKEGTNASIQVIQISHTGAALYNVSSSSWTLFFWWSSVANSSCF
jgi:hypothetical protein